MSLKKWKRKLKRWCSKRLNVFLIWLLPPLYRFYMLLVQVTSHTTYINSDELFGRIKRGANVIGAVWHQDAIISPFIHRGKRVVTMVSNNNIGNIMAQILSRCGFIPIRGGTSYSKKGKSRGGAEALSALTEYLQTHQGALCGIAVDGSRGPNRIVKPGIIFLAKNSGVPIFPFRSWCKWHILLPTWDRTMLPLPFNHIIILVGPPIYVPADISLRQMEQYRQILENELQRLALWSDRFFKR